MKSLVSKLEDIQNTIFNMSEEADRIIISYGSASDVRKILTNIRSKSMEMFGIIDEIEKTKEIT